MKRPIWKGPGHLGGLGKRKSVGPGEVIPDGHVTPERLEELGDRVEHDRPTVRPEPEPAPPSPPLKRGPGRPPGKKNK